LYLVLAAINALGFVFVGLRHGGKMNDWMNRLFSNPSG
jgi:hypothetical protein